MAKTLTVTRALTFSGAFENTKDNGSVVESIEIQLTQIYSHGTGANQANEYKDDTRSVAAASETIDLQTDLTDEFGTTLLFTSIKSITIKNLSSTSGESLTISGNFMGSILDATDSTHRVDAGGVWHTESPIDGYTVDATHKQLTIDPGSDTISYTLVLVGIV